MSGVRLEVKVHIVTGARIGGREHHQVRAPLRTRGDATWCCNRCLGHAVLNDDEKDLGVVPGGYRRRHHRYRGLHGRRDPPHRGDPDRRRPDHQRHRDGAAHADQGSRGDQMSATVARCASWPTRTKWWKCRASASAVRAKLSQPDAGRSDRAAHRGALLAGAGGTAPQRFRGTAVSRIVLTGGSSSLQGMVEARRRDIPPAGAGRGSRLPRRLAG